MRRIVGASLPLLSAALLVSSLAGCARSGASGSPEASFAASASIPGASVSPSTTVGPSTNVRPTLAPLPTVEASEEPLPTPIPTWPATGAMPPADPVGTVFMTLIQWSDTGGPVQMAALLDDGRFVRQSWDESRSGMLVRQLTPTALAAVRAEVSAVGLFDHSQTRALVKPLNCCGAGQRIDVTVDGSTVSVGALLAWPENYAPSAAWDRFDKLAGELAAPDGWIAADGWADTAWAQYHALSFCLTLDRQRTSETPALDASAIAWPDGTRPSATFGKPTWEGSDSRSGPISAESAYRLADSIVAAATAAGVANDGWYVTPLRDGGGLHTPLISDAPGWRLYLWLEPLMPGSQSCPWPA